MAGRRNLIHPGEIDSASKPPGLHEVTNWLNPSKFFPWTRVASGNGLVSWRESLSKCLRMR